MLTFILEPRDVFYLFCLLSSPARSYYIHTQFPFKMFINLCNYDKHICCCRISISSQLYEFLLQKQTQISWSNQTLGHKEVTRSVTFFVPWSKDRYNLAHHGIIATVRIRLPAEEELFKLISLLFCNFQSNPPINLVLFSMQTTASCVKFELSVHIISVIVASNCRSGAILCKVSFLTVFLLNYG